MPTNTLFHGFFLHFYHELYPVQSVQRSPPISVPTKVSILGDFTLFIGAIVTYFPRGKGLPFKVIGEQV